MDTVTLKIKNKRNFTRFMKMVNALDYVEVVQNDKSLHQAKKEGKDFFSLAGIWQDRDITQEDIRAKAWPKMK